MADQTLASMFPAAAFNGTELFYTLQGVNDRKATSSQFYNYITTVSSFATGATASLTAVSDTNITLALAGNSSAALWTPIVVTAGWTGTLSSGRLNANVVQTVTNDTNVTGVISSQNLTLGWNGVLPSSRIGTIGSSQVTGLSSISGTPGGAFGNIQFNNSGTFDGILNSSWDAVNSLFSLQANTLTFSSTSAVGRLIIDSTGRVLINSTTDLLIDTFPTIFTVAANGNTNFGQNFLSYGNLAGTSGLVFSKTRGTVASSLVAVGSNDVIGQIYFYGCTGAGGFQDIANINGAMDGNNGVSGPSANYGRIGLWVAHNAATSQERVRLDATGTLWLLRSSGTPVTPTAVSGCVNETVACFNHQVYGGV